VLIINVGLDKFVFCNGKRDDMSFKSISAASMMLFLILVSPARAEDFWKQVNLFDANNPQKTMDILFNTAWTPDGNSSGKIMYIFAGANCPASQRLFLKTRTLISKVQIRWIMAYGDSQQARDLDQTCILSKSSLILKQIFMNKRGDIKIHKNDYLEDWNYGVFVGMQSSLSQKGVPFIIYNTKEGVKYLLGIPSSLDFVDDIVEDKHYNKSTPAAFSAGLDNIKVYDISGMSVISGNHNVPFYSAPSLNSPVCLYLDKNAIMQVNKMAKLPNGEEWVFKRLTGTGLGLWARVGDFQQVKR